MEHAWAKAGRAGVARARVRVRVGYVGTLKLRWRCGQELAGPVMWGDPSELLVGDSCSGTSSDGFGGGEVEGWR